MQWNPIIYGANERGDIVLPPGAPFDGNPVLILTHTGIVEAWWDEGEWSEDTPISPAEFSGFNWVCYDDAFIEELDNATHWAAIERPAIAKAEGR
jgi:hypothetical protein